MTLSPTLKSTLLSAAALGAVLVYGSTFYTGGANAETAAAGSQAVEPALMLTTHKSPTCGCCGDWVDHMDAAGFTTDVKNTNDLNKIKQELGVDPRYQSCHTSVTQDGDYFFEGHIPAKLIKQFLQEKPAGAAGLAVPGMPVGSPGMEMGDRFRAYDVVQINSDGSTEIYATVNSAEEQY